MSKETFSYQTKGTCSVAIHLEIEDDRVAQCSFERGCAGNTAGIASLVAGQPVDTVIERLSGIQCQNGTSCPDQLANALKAWRQQKA